MAKQENVLNVFRGSVVTLSPRTDRHTESVGASAHIAARGSRYARSETISF